MLVSEISDDIYQTASAVLAADQKDALAKLKETLQRFISSNFAVCSGSIVDESGNRSSFFSIIICRVDNVFQPSDQKDVPADRVAAVVEFVEEIDLAAFREAYGLHRFAGSDAIGSSGATNWPDGQITSDFPKSCQAQESKIFCFRSHPNQSHN